MFDNIHLDLEIVDLFKDNKNIMNMIISNHILDNKFRKTFKDFLKNKDSLIENKSITKAEALYYIKNNLIRYENIAFVRYYLIKDLSEYAGYANNRLSYTPNFYKHLKNCLDLLGKPDITLTRDVLFKISCSEKSLEESFEESYKYIIE